MTTLALSRGDIAVHSLPNLDKFTLVRSLACFLKLNNLLESPATYGLGQRISYEVCRGRREIFNPISNQAQFGDTLLEALTNPSIFIRLEDIEEPCYQWYDRGDDSVGLSAYWRKVFHDDSKEQVKLAILCVIAMSVGWRPSNYKED